MKALAVAAALVAVAVSAQAGGSNYQYEGNRVLVEQRHYHNGNAEAALIGGLIVGTVIAFQNAQQPQVVYQQPQVIVQQPPVYQQPQIVYQQREMPVYSDRYAPPSCNPFYDQFGRMAGCMR